MKLKVLLPTRILVDQDAEKISAEAGNGAFTLLPRHVDYVSDIVPGLLSFVSGGREEFLAVDEGILVKTGPEVLVSTRRAVRGADLGELRRTVQEKFLELDEQERKARSILARFEADFVRRFMELKSYGG